MYKLDGKKLNVVLIILFVSLVIVGFLFFKQYEDRTNIKSILNTDAYSYLSDDVKKYIEQRYYQTLRS